MQVPIACSLTSAAARSQGGEWQELLSRSVVTAQRVSPTELSFRLRDDLLDLEGIVRLCQREKECCPFFDFAILISADDVVLRVLVPPDATAVIDEFIELVPSRSGARECAS